MVSFYDKRNIFGKPDKYSYFRLADGSADIFIRIFDHEEMNNEGDVFYVCRVNEFRTKQDLITEEMIAADPEKYLAIYAARSHYGT